MLNKKQFYFLSFTWGLPMTLLGLLVSVVLLCLGYRPKRFGGCWYFNVGHGWGGLELGLVFLTDSTDNEYVKTHEFGHAIQNCYYGLLMPFIVCIPSAIRYWYRELRIHIGIPNDTDYDDIWFEAEATELGYKYISQWQ